MFGPSRHTPSWHPQGPRTPRCRRVSRWPQSQRRGHRGVRHGGRQVVTRVGEAVLVEQEGNRSGQFQRRHSQGLGGSEAGAPGPVPRGWQWGRHRGLVLGKEKECVRRMRSRSQMDRKLDLENDRNCVCFGVLTARASGQPPRPHCVPNCSFLCVTWPKVPSPDRENLAVLAEIPCVPEPRGRAAGPVVTATPRPHQEGDGDSPRRNESESVSSSTL